MTSGPARMVARIALVPLLAAPAAGCAAGRGGAGSESSPATTATTAAATVTTRQRPRAPASPTTVGSTPTTNFAPNSPQASASDASTQLVAAWASGDRNLARAVASPAAVAALFAVPYPGAGLAIPRGCSVAFPPLVCTYGPAGGASPGDSIYQLYVSQTPEGWYVSSVSVLS